MGTALCLKNDVIEKTPNYRYKELEIIHFKTKYFRSIHKIF